MAFCCLAYLLVQDSSTHCIQHLNNFDLFPPLDNSNQRFPVVNASSLGSHSTLSVNLHSTLFHFLLESCKQSCFLMKTLTLSIIPSVLYISKWLTQMFIESFSQPSISASVLQGALLPVCTHSVTWGLL